MTPEEIEKFEKDTNSIVVFNNCKGISFQCADSEALAIIIDGVRRPFVMITPQIERLKAFLNKNF
jgi:hypothetical protein